MGDTVQFIRFMPLLRKIARESVVWRQPEFVPLLQTARRIEVEYEVDIELIELPHVLGTTSRSGRF